MSEPTDADRERADDLAEYLADFTYGKGYTEADCIFDALQDARKNERARIVAALHSAENRERLTDAGRHEIAALISTGEL